MTDEKKKEPFWQKVLAGILIATIPAIILYLIGIGSSNKSDQSGTSSPDTLIIVTQPVKIQDSLKISIPSGPPNQNLSTTPSFNLTNDAISGIIYDLEGIGLGGVEIWCESCADKNRITTKEDGSFRLVLKYILEDKDTQRIKVCYRYKSHQSCLSEHFKYLNFKFPKLPRK